MNEHESDEGDEKCIGCTETTLHLDKSSINLETEDDLEEFSKSCVDTCKGQHSSGNHKLNPVGCNKIDEVMDSITDDDCTNEMESNNGVALKRRNEYLHRMLLEFLKSGSTQQYKNLEDDDFTLANLESIYQKALSDHKSAYTILAHQTESFSEMSLQLRERLREKERKADNLTKKLNRYRLDIAQQSSFSNGRPLDDKMFEDLANRTIDDDLERERLRCATNKVSVKELEQKIRAKNELAGGISLIEFCNLEDDVKRLNEKILSFGRDIVTIDAKEQHFLKLKTFLQKRIHEYKEKNQSAEMLLRELDNSIRDKRSRLKRLENEFKLSENNPEHDKDGIEVFLKSRLVNDNYISSKDELISLRRKLNELGLRHSLLLGHK